MSATDNEKSIRGFHHLATAWYAKSCIGVESDNFVDEVMIGLYYPGGGGTDGEFAIRWTRLGGKITPRLEVFDDAWLVLQQFRDLLDRLAGISGQDASPTAVCALLMELGIADMTQRISPY